MTSDRSSIIRYLIETTRKYADYISMKYLKRGEFVGITWREVMEITRLFSLGFQSLGIESQDRVAIMSKTRYEWRLVDYGIMFAGGTSVTLYPSLTDKQTAYIIDDSDSKIIVVDKARNLGKVLKVINDCPKLEYVIYISEVPDELKTDSRVFGLDELIKKGEAFDQEKSRGDVGDIGASELKKNIADLEKRIQKTFDKEKIQDYLTQCHEMDFKLAEKTHDPFITRYLSIKDADVATIVYTSGTTGVPKGALLSHYNMAFNTIQVSEYIPLEQHDVALAFLPLSHVFERQAGHFLATYRGYQVAYARDTDSLIENMDQIKPTFLVSVPRIYEKLYDRILGDILEDDDEDDLERFEKLVDWGMEYQKALQDDEDMSVKIAFKNWVADKLMFQKVRKILGDRLRFMISGGAALNKTLGEFFFACGFKIMEGYGLTETSPVLTVNPLNKIKPGAVGVAVRETKIKIAADGEILASGPQIFQGYWNKPEENATAFTVDEDGTKWYHTGDLGILDSEGYVKITGRKKTVIVLRTGKKVSPIVTEAVITLDRHITHVCVIGDDLKYLIGVVEPNWEYLGEWLEKNGHPWTVEQLEVEDGMGKDRYEEVVSLRRQIIKLPEVNAFYNGILNETQKDLSGFEKIKRFALVADDWNEYNVMTPSLKMKRRTIDEFYKKEISETYKE